MWLMWSLAAFAGSPAVEIAWKGSAAELLVVPPSGEEVAAEAPVDLALRWRDRELRWAGTGGGLPLPLHEVAGSAVEGELTVSLCDKATGVCRPTTVAVTGEVPPERKGRVALVVSEPEPEPDAEHAAAYRTDAEAVASAAFAEAARDGKRVLLDFGAVWCPPCNLLSAEVLHAEPRPVELDGVVVAALDVDDPRSWALKDRYEVGGYPTVVVVEPDGTEISRVEGYPGRQEFLDWLGTAAGQPEPDTDLSTLDPATVAPERASEIAWLLTRRGDDAEAWVARAEEGEPTRALRLARVQVRPNVEDARWLVDNAPGEALSWVPGARKLAEQPEGRAALHEALHRDLARAKGLEVADLLYLLADLPDTAHAPVLYAAAAASLKTAFSGDPELDRAQYTWLAILLERAGDLDGAVAFLDDASAHWPDEPTFAMAAASALLRAERHEDALVQTGRALQRAWGDNKLRAARSHCEALMALGRANEAAGVVEEVLAEVPQPPEGLDVRTPRYREQLSACLEPEPETADGAQ